MTQGPTPSRPPSARLPAWARAADALAVALGGLALLIAGFGGFRVHAFGSRVSVTSGARILAAAVVVLLVRHLVWRDQPLYLRAGRALVRWWSADGVRAAIPVWTASRLAVLAIAYGDSARPRMSAQRASCPALPSGNARPMIAISTNSPSSFA